MKYIFCYYSAGQRKFKSLVINPFCPDFCSKKKKTKIPPKLSPFIITNPKLNRLCENGIYILCRPIHGTVTELLDIFGLQPNLLIFRAEARFTVSFLNRWINPTACPDLSGAKDISVFTQYVKHGVIENQRFKPAE